MTSRPTRPSLSRTRHPSGSSSWSAHRRTQWGMLGDLLHGGSPEDWEQASGSYGTNYPSAAGNVRFTGGPDAAFYGPVTTVPYALADQNLGMPKRLWANAFLQLNPEESFSFTSLSFDVTAPSALTETRIFSAAQQFVIHASSQDDSLTPDLGAWPVLSPVPEPDTLALLLFCWSAPVWSGGADGSRKAGKRNR